MADIGKLLFKEQFRPRTSIGWLFALAPAISMLTAVATRRDHPVLGHRRHLRHQGRALRHRPEHRDPVRVRVRRDRLLRADARRLGVGLEVLVPRRDALRRAADLLRGRAGALARRRGDDGRHAVADRDRRGAGGQLWFIVPQFVGFIIFLVAGFAETNRPPFDLARGRRRARRRLQHRVRRRPLRRVLRRRVPQHGRRLRARRDAVPRRLAHARSARPADVGRPDRRAREDDALRLLLHLGARDAAAPALRPADVASAGRSAAAGDAQRPRDRDPGGDSTDADAPGPRRRRRSPSSAARAPAAPAAPTARSARRCAA